MPTMLTQPWIVGQRTLWMTVLEAAARTSIQPSRDAPAPLSQTWT
jgi:hypothetical protein